MNSLRARVMPLLGLVVVAVVSVFAWRLLADAALDGDPELRTVASRPANPLVDDLVPAPRHARDEVAPSDAPPAAVPNSAPSSIAPPSEPQAGLEDMLAQPDRSYMLALHVVDERGADVPGAEVRVWDDEAAYRSNPGAPLPARRADALGRTRVSVPSRDAVLLASSFDGRDSGWIFVAAFHVGDENEVVLYDPVCCRGHVIEADGRPAPGCTVEVAARGVVSHPHLVEPVVSEHDGSFSITYSGMVSQTIWLQAVRGEESSPTKAGHAEPCSLIDVLTPRPVELVLPGSIFRIEGVALDGLGQRVPGVTIEAGTRGERVRATTDAEGRFALEPEQPDVYRLTVQPGDGDPAWMLASPVSAELDASRRVAEVVVPLVKGTPLRGRVVGRSPDFDPDGLRVAALPSQALGRVARQQMAAPVDGFVGLDGLFELFPVHPDVDYDLVVSDPSGARVLEVRDVPGTSPPLTLVVDGDVPLPTLVGRVSRACDPSLPVSGAHVRVFVPGSWGWVEQRPEDVGSDGGFAVDLAQRDTSHGDRLLDWFVLVEAEGYASRMFGPGDPRTWNLPLDVRLRERDPILVEVIDAEGEPVDAGLVNGRFVRSDPRSGLPKDAWSGETFVAPIENGLARVEARASWPDMIEVTAYPHPAFAVRVPPPSDCGPTRLRVVVGEPMPAVDTTLVFRGSRGEIPAGASLTIHSPGNEQSLVLDADGRARAMLAPGLTSAHVEFGIERHLAIFGVPPEGGEVALVIE